MLPTALAELGPIDEYRFVVHTRVAGRGPTLLGSTDEFLMGGSSDLLTTGFEEGWPGWWAQASS